MNETKQNSGGCGIFSTWWSPSRLEFLTFAWRDRYKSIGNQEIIFLVGHYSLKHRDIMGRDDVNGVEIFVFGEHFMVSRRPPCWYATTVLNNSGWLKYTGSPPCFYQCGTSPYQCHAHQLNYGQSDYLSKIRKIISRSLNWGTGGCSFSFIHSLHLLMLSFHSFIYSSILSTLFIPFTYLWTHYYLWTH